MLDNICDHICLLLLHLLTDFKSSLNSKLSLLNVMHYIFIIKTSLRKNKLCVACVPETALSVALGRKYPGRTFRK